jgi:hypothetical protein
LKANASAHPTVVRPAPAPVPLSIKDLIINRGYVPPRRRTTWVPTTATHAKSANSRNAHSIEVKANL